MRVPRFHRMAAVTGFCVLLATSGLGGAPQLQQDERARLAEYLTSMRDQVVAESGSLSDAQWAFKPGPDRWSVGEVVEHLALAEDLLFDLQQKVVKGPRATAEQIEAARGQDEVVRKRLPDRTQRANAPEPLQPAARLGSRAEVMMAFTERRARTIEYVRSTGDDLRAYVSDSLLGNLDGYQWLLVIAAHNERHLGQIREVKGSPGFPQ